MTFCEEKKPSQKMFVSDDEPDGIDTKAVTQRCSISVFWKIFQNSQSLY